MVLELNKYEYPLVLNNTTFETNLTIMFWIKLDNNRNTRELLIGTNPFIFAIILEKSLSNQISFYCGNGTKINGKHAKYRAYTGRLPYDEFQHICFTRDANEIKVYINSTLKRTYTFNMNDLNLEKEDINIGITSLYYLTNLTQELNFLKLLNETLSPSEILKIVNYNNFKYYYDHNTSKMSHIFNTGDMNYIFYYDGIKYIYNENMLNSYIRSDSQFRPYNSFIKFNYLSEEEKTSSLNDISLNIDEDLLHDSNIDTIVRNIMSWQFGMYQDKYPKNIPGDTTGFWSTDINNFIFPYTGPQLKYNIYRGSFQEGTGTFIKLIIDYYLKYKTTSSLISDCLQSINLLIGFLNQIPYDNGGIPLYYPLTGRYHDNITLNDCAMINYLRCCEYILNSDIKQEIESEKISLLESNYNKSLNCLLDIQFTIDGKKTIWPQQADPITLQPVKGRSFEVESICSLESTQILIYLMSLSKQSNEIKNAIKSGCEWFETHSISGYKQHIVDGDITLSQTDENVNLLWSRYYSLTDQTAVFFDRDSNKYTLETFNNLPAERRNGYNWLGMWGSYLLEIYDYWKKINL
jgi:PelA/Pel-15E family pectate lyase